MSDQDFETLCKAVEVLVAVLTLDQTVSLTPEAKDVLICFGRMRGCRS